MADQTLSRASFLRRPLLQGKTFRTRIPCSPPSISPRRPFYFLHCLRKCFVARSHLYGSMKGQTLCKRKSSNRPGIPPRRPFVFLHCPRTLLESGNQSMCMSRFQVQTLRRKCKCCNPQDSSIFPRAPSGFLDCLRTALDPHIHLCECIPLLFHE